MKIVSLYKIWRGYEYLVKSIESNYAHVDKMIFVSSDISWTGKKGNNTEKVVESWKSKNDRYSKIEILQCNTKDQAEQYKAGLSYIQKDCPCDWIQIVDSDEVWPESEWLKVLSYLHKYRRLYKGFSANMRTFIKSPEYVINESDKCVRPVVIVRGDMDYRGIRFNSTPSLYLMRDVVIDHYALIRDNYKDIEDKFKNCIIGDKYKKLVNLSKWKREVWDPMPNGKCYHYYKGLEKIWHGFIKVSDTNNKRSKGVKNTISHENNNSGRMISICSSKERPDRLKTMIESWVNTVESNAPLLAIYVSKSDKKIKQYKKLSSEIPNKNVVFEFGAPKSLVEVNNYYCQKYINFGYFHEINDDHICRTSGWDVDFMGAVDSKNAGYTIAYGKTQNMPSSVMFGGKLIRAIGYMFPKEFKHSYIDNWLMKFGQSANLFAYVPTAFIEHMHHLYGLSKKDSVYDGVLDDYENGKKAFNKVLSKMTEMTKKVIELIRKESPYAAIEEQARIDYERAGIPEDYGPDHRDWNNPGKYAWRHLWMRVNGL